MGRHVSRKDIVYTLSLAVRSVIFVNKNENGEKWENNEFVNQY